MAVATNERLIHAPAEQVFEVIADPNSWSEGFSRVERDPGCRVVFEVKHRRFGASRVELEVITQNGTTCVRMVEQPTGGLLKPLNNGLLEMVAYQRNGRALDRIAKLAEAALSAGR
jgi:hypothetical protein